MSSSTPGRRDRRPARLAALVVSVCVVVWLFPGTAAAVPVPPATALHQVAVLPPTDRGVSLVVEVGAFTRPRSVSVSVSGVPQPETITPVMSDRLLVSLVVDASADAGPTLPALVSGAARFVVDAPAGARSAVIADTTPPVPLAPLQAGSAGPVRALKDVKAHGQRRTVDALSLAVEQLPRNAVGPRVVVLYTTAPDVGGPPAEDVSASLRAAHAMLVVVSTAPGTRYWSTVTRATGGFLAPAGPGSVAPALDQVDTMLRARYLVSIPTPARLPAVASVRIDTGQVVLNGDAVVPVPPPAPGRGQARTGWTVLGLAAIAVAVLAAVAAVLALERRRRDIPTGQEWQL